MLRALRELRKDLREKGGRSHADRALILALNAVRTLEIPHLEPEEEEGEVVH